MNHCEDHGSLNQKVTDMHEGMNSKFKVAYVILTGIGSVMIAILVVLIMNISSYKEMSVRLDHAEKQVLEVKDIIKTVLIPRHERITYHGRQEN